VTPTHATCCVRWHEHTYPSPTIGTAAQRTSLLHPRQPRLHCSASHAVMTSQTEKPPRRALPKQRRGKLNQTQSFELCTTSQADRHLQLLRKQRCSDDTNSDTTNAAGSPSCLCTPRCQCGRMNTMRPSQQRLDVNCGPKTIILLPAATHTSSLRTCVPQGEQVATVVASTASNVCLEDDDLSFPR